MKCLTIMRNRHPPYPNQPRPYHPRSGIQYATVNWSLSTTKRGHMTMSHPTPMSNFHPLSWRTIKFRRLAWHKWLFRLQARVGYGHYAAFWADRPSPDDCPVCSGRHNSSMHGILVHNSQEYPLVAAWLASWPSLAVVSSSRATTYCQDLRVTGHLAVPKTLYAHLRSHQGGVKGPRQIVSRFQDTVLDKVTADLANTVPPLSPRLLFFASKTGTHPPCFCDTVYALLCCFSFRPRRCRSSALADMHVVLYVPPIIVTSPLECPSPPSCS